MKTIQQHLDGQACSFTGMTFTEILKDKCYTDIQVQEITDIVHVAAGAYAQQVAEDVRNRCAENAQSAHVGNGKCVVDPETILYTEITLP